MLGQVQARVRDKKGRTGHFTGQEASGIDKFTSQTAEIRNRSQSKTQQVYGQPPGPQRLILVELEGNVSRI